MNSHALAQFALLQGFSDAELDDLAKNLETRTLAADDYLFHEHDTSTEIYFIQRGEIEVYRTLADNTQQRLAVLSAGDEVGELALVDGSPRSASARVLSDTQVWVMLPSRLPFNLMLLSRLISNIALVGTQKLRSQKHNAQAGDTPLLSKSLTATLQQFNLLQGLSNSELSLLAQALETRQLVAGEYLFHEHDSASEIYFISRGEIDVCKPDTTGTQQVIAVLEQGQEVGELALIDGEPRSASARAVSDSEVLVLNTANLPNNLVLLSRLISNLTKASTDKLRRSNVGYVQSLERELAAARLQNEFGQFFIYILSIFTIGTFVNHLLQTYLHSINVYGEFFKWTYLLVLLVPSFVTIFVMKIPLSALGITKHNWKKSLKEGLLVSAGFSVVFVAFVLIMRYFTWLPDKPMQITIAGFLNYSMHSFLQEILARGITQSSFERFFNDKRGIKAILLTSICFSLFHIHFGLIAVAITFISSLAFGAFYMRHHNLLGVTIVHAVTGICAFGTGVL